MATRVRDKADLDAVKAIEQAAKNASTIRDLELRKVLDQAEIDAVKMVPGPIQFQVTEYGKKDEKTGKPVASSWKVPEQVARELAILQSVATEVWGKYRILEPDVSDIFNAPECYEKANSDSHIALKRAMQSTNSKYRHAMDTLRELDPVKRQLTDQQSMQFAAAKLLKQQAEKMITQAIGYLFDHYKARQNPDTEAGSKRSSKSVQSLIDTLVVALKRRADSKKELAADRKVAEIARDMLLWVRIDPQAANKAWKTFEAERTAQPRGMTAAEASAAKIPTAESIVS
jgi:hypothetical protein